MAAGSEPSVAEAAVRPVGLLMSRESFAAHREALASAARECRIELRLVHPPQQAGASLSSAERERVDIAFLTRDVRSSGRYGDFLESLMDCPRLQWVHFVSAGLDAHPSLGKLAARGVRLTTSAGSNGEAVAHAALAGLLMLARHFPHWWAAQGRREWVPLRGEYLPRDLKGQTVLIIDVGSVGATVGSFCRALGMRVIGVRRSPLRHGDPVDEMHPPRELPNLLPRSDWLVLACPLAPETAAIIDARALAALPRGARLINVARGGLVDETALIAALESGQLGGAYLDVFEREPLPASSALWRLPNVILSPHNAAASSGNPARVLALFLANLAHWASGKPLLNLADPA